MGQSREFCERIKIKLPHILVEARLYLKGRSGANGADRVTNGQQSIGHSVYNDTKLVLV